MRARDVAFMRKLCSLGLPPHALVPSLLPALRQLIPAHSAGVFWVDANGQMTELYAERMLPPEAMAAYHERHYRNAVAGFSEAFRRRAERADPVSSHSFSAAERETDYFRDVLKPLDAFHVLYGVLRRDERPIGQVSLYRGEADSPFDTDHAAALRQVLRYLAAGLAGPERTDVPSNESLVVEESLGVVDTSGAIRLASSDWRKLVRLASLSRVAPSEARTEAALTEAFLQSLARDARADQPAESVRQTAWGRFVLRVFPLEEANASRPCFGVLIRREEPRMVALVRGAGHSMLSPQQREVALLLAQGRTNPEIADALGLTLNTASYHVKQVYAKLEVNDRADVPQVLLRLAQADLASR